MAAKRDHAAKCEGKPGAADRSEPSRHEAAERLRSEEGVEVEPEHATSDRIRRAELERRVRVRGPQREAEARGEEEGYGERQRADRREEELRKAEAGRPGEEQREARAPDGRGQERSRERACAEGGAEDPEDLRPRVQRVLSEHRQEDVEVEGERADKQHEQKHETHPRLVAGVANRLPGAGEDRGSRSGALQAHEIARSHCRETTQHGEEADGVDGKAHAGAEGGDDDSADRRPDDSRRVEEGGVERDGVW